MRAFYKILHLLTKNPKMNNIQVLFWIFDSVVLKFIKKPKKSDAKKVLLVFTHALGDIVMFMGSIKYLKEIFDGYEISILCNEQYAELVEDQFDNVIAVDFQRTSLDPLFRIKYFKTLREYYYEYSIDPMETPTYSPNLFASHAVVANNKIGIESDKKDVGKLIKIYRNSIYTRLIHVSSLEHRVKNFSDFFSAIADKRFEPHITKLPTYQDSKLPEKYFIVYPSASIPLKRWPVEQYAEIANRVYENYELPLVCCGTVLDRETVDEFIKLLIPGIKIIDLVEKTSVKEFINVIGNANIVITNDTSVYHIALATRRKTCIVTGEYTYDSFADYYAVDLHDELRLEIVSGNMDCRNCFGGCSKKINRAYPCLECVETDNVWNLVKQLMNDECE